VLGRARSGANTTLLIGFCALAIGIVLTFVTMSGGAGSRGLVFTGLIGVGLVNVVPGLIRR
jgi:hypothetical protein